MKMMKPTNALLFPGALAAGALLAGAAHCGSLVAGKSLNIASDNHSSKPGGSLAYHIRLNGEKAGFAAIHYQTPEGVDGPPFTVAFGEAIQGYRFVAAHPAHKMITVASKGVSITMTTADPTFDSHGSSIAKIWETAVPGPDLGKPATAPDFAAGIRDINNVTGSIDISGLASGTVYFFYGSFRNHLSITACMLDADGTEAPILVPGFHNGDFANNHERYVSSLTFVNDAGHDTIEYDFASSGGRWEGIVVTGKAAP